MAPLAKSLAVAATAFAALGAAAPGHGHMHNHKRDEVTVWNTVTEVVWRTVDVTTTVTKGQSVPTTRIEETVNEATAPAAKPKEATSTSTSTSTVQLTSSTTEAAAPSVETNVQVPTVSIPTQEPAPEPTQEPEPEPTTTTQQPPPVETSTVEPQPQPTQSSGGGGGSSGGPCSSGSPCTGQVTFYDVATSRSAPSSCGNVNDGSTDKVLALPVGIMQDDDCGKTVTIKYKGKTSTAQVVDKCMGCDNTSIDLSRAAFLDLASESEGRLYGVEWFMQ